LTIHPSAAIGFASAADVYERARPSYPQDAVEWLVAQTELGPSRTVVDLGAGTGKLTRLLLASGARVIAVEPIAEMRAHIQGAEVLDGTAEAIPLDDASVDAVFVAQAFHWFDPDRALAEISRVLRPGGFLALLWNDRDDDVAWVVELDEIMHGEQAAAVAHMPGYASRASHTDHQPAGIATIAASGSFSAVTAITGRHAPDTTAEAVVDAVRSRSYIGSLPASDRDAVLRRVRALVADFPTTFPMPYVTRAFWCQLLSPISS